MSKLPRKDAISQAMKKLLKFKKEYISDKILTQDRLPHLGEDLTKNSFYRIWW
jgi:hypothetical protein